MIFYIKKSIDEIYEKDKENKNNSQYQEIDMISEEAIDTFIGIHENNEKFEGNTYIDINNNNNVNDNENNVPNDFPPPLR